MGTPRPHQCKNQRSSFMGQEAYVGLLRDMLAACERITRFTIGMTFQEFCENEMAAYAVIRAFEIMGEAARGIPASERRRSVEIPWQKIIGMRDKLIHGYAGVDLELVWSTVQQDVPPLKPLLAQAIAEAEGR